MKKFIVTLAAVMLMTVLAATAAFASDYDSAAKELSGIGMFRGTGTGFELDRAPTRAEAAVMLVRMYGAEDQAKADFAAGKLADPFTDVKNYAAPYVAWLYNKGLTTGTSATTFTPAAACSDQMYCAFVLRALGYDSSDFKYADTLAFAEKKGFYSAEMFSGKFLRDDLAAVTYQALAADMKDGSTYLLDSLVKSGAVDKTAAQSMETKMETYRAMEKSMAAVDSGTMDADVTMTMDYNMDENGTKTSSKTVTSGNMKMITKGTDIQMAEVMKTTADGADAGTSSVWMKDGWMYVQAVANGTTSQYKYAVADELAAARAMEGTDLTNSSTSALAIIKSIEAKTAGTDTVYTFVADGKALSGLANELLGSMGLLSSSGLNIDMGDMTMTVTVSSAGVLKTMTVKYAMSMNMNADGESIKMDAVYDTTMKINSVGSAVTITFPDFSGYKELSAEKITGSAA